MPKGLPQEYAKATVCDLFSVVGQARHTDALKLLAFWEGRPADGIVVGRDVPCRAIARLLSNIIISEPTKDKTDMRVRLAGASLLKRFGGDVKGRMLSELFPPEDFRDHLRNGLNAIETDRPVILDSSLVAGKLEQMHLEVVLLPVVAPDRKNKWILGGLFYFR